jgi:hypothetical protein
VTFVESRPEQVPAGGERSGEPATAARGPLLAGVEVLAALGLGYAAQRSWGNGSVTIHLGISDAGLDTVTRSFGNWLTIGIMLGMLSGLLLVDAGRRVLQLRQRRQRY